MNETIVKQHKQNFETLRKAFLNGQVSLMDCTIKATGEHVAVICAMSPQDNQMEFIPFAMLFNDNPYEILVPPSA